MAGRLLLVDDDRFFLNPMSHLLGVQGYQCTTVATAQEALRVLERERIDLILLDVGLPDVDGVSLCRQIRARYRMPIIMLTARNGASEVRLGRDAGADDYISKPFEPQELLARVRAQLRMRRTSDAPGVEDNRIRVGPLVIDLAAREVSLDDRRAALTEREYALLEVLTRHRGRALERDWLFEQIWGAGAAKDVRTLPVYMRRLRSKLERDPAHPEYLITVRGFGYKLRVPPDNL